MNDVIACLRLLETWAAALHVGSERVKDVPVRLVVTGSKLIAAVLNHAYGARRPGCHPWENGGLSLRPIANPDGRAPGVAFICRELDEDIMVV